MAIPITTLHILKNTKLSELDKFFDYYYIVFDDKFQNINADINHIVTTDGFYTEGKRIDINKLVNYLISEEIEIIDYNNDVISLKLQKNSKENLDYNNIIKFFGNNLYHN